MVSTNQRADQWQVDSDTHGHNVVVVFEPTTALAQNINTAVIELEQSIDIKSLADITPFSFAKLGSECAWAINKVVEEYFASYYFKVRVSFRIKTQQSTENLFRYSHGRTMVRILPRVSFSRTSALLIAGKPG